MLDREEYIEQAYLFRSFGERIMAGIAAQEALAAIGEEVLPRRSYRWRLATWSVN